MSSAEYEPAQLKISVRDNVCGIDAAALPAGRDGHWGLRGVVRERAEQLERTAGVWAA